MANGTLEKSMQKFKYGDKEAFNTIYDETHQFVFYFAYSILKDQEAAKDVMQNTYYNIMSKIAQYQDNTNANAWITTIVRNLALDEMNKNKKYQLVDVDQNEYLFGSEDPKVDVDTPLIDLAKKILSEEEFQIISLCVLADYTREEVGKILHKPTSTITWKYLEAMKKLKKEIKKKEV